MGDEADHDDMAYYFAWGSGELDDRDPVTEDELREEDSRLDAEEWQQREQDALDWERMDRPEDRAAVQAWGIVAEIGDMADRMWRALANDPELVG